MTTLEVALRHAAETLALAGIEAPRREARLLALHVMGHPAGAMPDPATLIDDAAFGALVARRAAHEPLAFITGSRGFWSLDLRVGPDTLIPRADSETLIEAALAEQPRRSEVQAILDLGTGTGCLLLAALTEYPGAWGLGVDRAPAAAALAAGNAARAGLGGRAAFLAGSWGDALGAAASFDLILCNPPYIASADIAGLMPEVARFEPASALDGGPDGLDAYASIMPALARLLRPAGAAIVELGQGQQAAVAALAGRAGLAPAACRDDLSGTPRALVLKHRGHEPYGKKPFGNADVGS